MLRPQAKGGPCRLRMLRPAPACEGRALRSSRCASPCLLTVSSKAFWVSASLTSACTPQAMNSLVTVQIATGDTNLVSNVRTNLITDVQSGAILVRCHRTLPQPQTLNTAPARTLAPLH